MGGNYHLILRCLLYLALKRTTVLCKVKSLNLFHRKEKEEFLLLPLNIMILYYVANADSFCCRDISACMIHTSNILLNKLTMQCISAKSMTPQCCVKVSTKALIYGLPVVGYT